MITQTNVRRPDDVLELGTKVRYHHRACVMRMPKEPPREWMSCRPGDPDKELWVSVVEKFHAVGVNKTVAVWPEEGTGTVIALIRKGIGNSHSGYTSGFEYPEFEPGYFEAKEWVWLYVVKHSMKGLDDITLHPMDAVSPASKRVVW